MLIKGALTRLKSSYVRSVLRRLEWSRNGSRYRELVKQCSVRQGSPENMPGRAQVVDGEWLHPFHSTSGTSARAHFHSAERDIAKQCGIAQIVETNES